MKPWSGHHSRDVVSGEWEEVLTKVRQRPGWQTPQLSTAALTIAGFVKHLAGLSSHLGLLLLKAFGIGKSRQLQGRLRAFLALWGTCLLL